MRVMPPDLVTWLMGYVSDAADADGFEVDVVGAEPEDLELPLTRPLIVIRIDPGSRVDWTTFDRSVGASVLGGSKNAPTPIVDLARWLASVLFDDELPLATGSPIARVDFSGCNGPYAVPDELDVARQYMTAQYVVEGSW
ncbi:hypothetical protein [Microbacterium algeriense]|uniref:Tail terminator n=2 Tax=Microbacterium algeriense TaxID=2615184 RepID=A0ABQ6VAD5_9MICO|nr:hypothetical protein [Microbacterium algeriense]KAB1867335.1 hypothetical protein F6A08_05990 [Microbacterium algeriense]